MRRDDRQMQMTKCWAAHRAGDPYALDRLAALIYEQDKELGLRKAPSLQALKKKLETRLGGRRRKDELPSDIGSLLKLIRDSNGSDET